MKRKIKCQSFISLICYSLIGKSVNKIQPKTLNMLCLRVNEYYTKEHKTQILYTENGLLEYIHTFSNKENYRHFQIFQSALDENNNLIFVEESIKVLQQLSILFSDILHEEFYQLYPFINDFINMYQLIECIEFDPTKT